VEGGCHTAYTDNHYNSDLFSVICEEFYYNSLNTVMQRRRYGRYLLTICYTVHFFAGLFGGHYCISVLTLIAFASIPKRIISFVHAIGLTNKL